MSHYKPLHNRILKVFLQCSKSVVRNIKTSTPLGSSCTLAHSPNAKLNKNVIDRYMCLPPPECVSTVEYVWIDGTGEQVRSKGRTLQYVPESHKEVPGWTFDNRETFQPIANDSEVILTPVAIYNDPFRRSSNKIVLCEVYEYDGKPLPTNHRKSCAETLNKICEHEIMWGIEQQYVLMDVDERPLGWPVMLGEPRLTGANYCGVGAGKAVGREIAESHYRACLYAGVQMAGINCETTYGQWEFQLGICPSIKGADDLWMARFLLSRVAEEYGVLVHYTPYISHVWPSAGCHINLSTKATRADGGLSTIQQFIEKLSKRHEAHMKKYDPNCGADNKRRLKGKTGGCVSETFKHGIADRSVSVRIPKETACKKKGHFEDRRPPGNCDPYSVCDIIVRTCLLDEC